MPSDQAEASGRRAGPPRAKQTMFSLALAWRIRPVRWIVYNGLIVIAAIAIAGAFGVSKLRDNVIADTERDLQNVTSVLAEHFERTFEALTLTQLGVVQDVQALGITSANDYARRVTGEDMHRRLAVRVGNLLPVHEFIITDAQGNILNSSRTWPAPAGNIAKEDYFSPLLSSHALTSDIGAPTRDPVNGLWRVPVAHSIIGGNNEFLGVIVGFMRLQYFEELFANLHLGEGSSISLVRRDGLLLARLPRVNMAAKPSYANNPLFKTVLPRDGKGAVRLNGIFDGRERISAGQNLGRHTAAVAVTRETDIALAGWHQNAWAFISFAVLMLAAIAVIIAACAWQVGKRLNKNRYHLNTALDHMSHGLCLFDANGVLVMHNARYLEILGIPHGLLAPGMGLREMLRRLKKAGILHADDAEIYADEIMSTMHAGKTIQMERKLEDGRVIYVTSRPLPEGGWVATHEDITALKGREDELTLQNMKFDAALQNMSHGIVMYDAEDRLIVCNQKYSELYGLPPELVKPGITHRQILQHRLAAGIIAPEEAGGYIADRTSKASTNRASDSIVKLSDGRTILVQQRPMANGGRVTTHEDITERREAEARIAHMAHHDALTDLPNRVLLRERLEAGLLSVKRGAHLAVLYLDLDHFKGVNDTLGHNIGDSLLKDVAARLRDCVREGDTIARLGGDEFAIIQANINEPSDAAVLAQRIRDALGRPYDIDGHQLPIDVSIGISLAPSDTTDPEHLLKNADMALYRSKADGRGTYRFFEPEMDERVKARRSLELDLRNAIPKGEFELYYQPLVNFERGDISCCETLIRWHHPTRGMVSPIEFIPVAEETGLINAIGEWVLRQACIEAATWPVDIAIAVNLSPVQFRNPALTQIVVAALHDAGLPAHRLELEITEAVLLQNTEGTLETLRKIQELGVRISMDDFGTGYSSLSYLRSFPFDKIKIDRSFITNVADQNQSNAIVQAVTELAGRLQIATTAEGVETPEQLASVKALGVTEMQGYLYSRPIPAKDVIRLFETHKAKDHQKPRVA